MTCSIVYILLLTFETSFVIDAWFAVRWARETCQQKGIDILPLAKTGCAGCGFKDTLFTGLFASFALVKLTIVVISFFIAQFINSKVILNTIVSGNIVNSFWAKSWVPWGIEKPLVIVKTHVVIVDLVDVLRVFLKLNDISS